MHDDEMRWRRGRACDYAGKYERESGAVFTNATANDDNMCDDIERPGDAATTSRYDDRIVESPPPRRRRRPDSERNGMDAGVEDTPHPFTDGD